MEFKALNELHNGELLFLCVSHYILCYFINLRYSHQGSYKTPLSAAERQRRCREKDPEKVAEINPKDFERYHARKKLVKDMTAREHTRMKRKWRVINKKRREQKNVLLNTTVCTHPPFNHVSNVIFENLLKIVLKDFKRGRLVYYELD